MLEYFNKDKRDANLKVKFYSELGMMNQEHERHEILYNHHEDLEPIIDAAFYNEERCLVIKNATEVTSGQCAHHEGYERFLNIRSFNNEELLPKTLISKVDMKKFLM